MSPMLQHLVNQPNTVQFNEDLEGLTSWWKVYDKNGNPMFLLITDADLDTDGVNTPGVHYESTHQNQTSIDPSGSWFNSNDINGGVWPGHSDHPIAIGTLFYWEYDGHKGFGVIFDGGPSKKIGEFSMRFHRVCGHEPIKADHTISDVSLANNVKMLVMVGHLINNGARTRFTQADVDAQGAKALAYFGLSA